MILLVDIGNTSAKLRFYKHQQDEPIFQHQLIIELKNITAQTLTDSLTPVTKIVVAGVASDEYVRVIESWSAERGIPFVQVLTERSRFGVDCIYEDPNRFGVDRWLALLGAKKSYSECDCLIVDAGTATNIELLAKSGKQVGGWIIPGLELLQTSLFNATEKVLGQAEYISDLSAGSSTQSCVSHGALLATTGAIEKAFHEYCKDMPKLRLILTGGNAELVASQLSVPYTIDQELLFKGMALYL